VAAGVSEPDEELGSGRSYRGRFVAVFCALALVVVGAGIGAAVLATGDEAEPEREWSAWKPTLTGTRGARQVASHVSRGFRLDNGDQLAAARVGLPALQDVPVTVAISKPQPAGREGDNVEFVPGTPTIYLLCGLGERCAIRGGTKSVARGMILRQEALEMILYSFRYLDSASVAVFMPPPPGEEATVVMFARRSDVAPLLDPPLAAVLPGDNSRPKDLSPKEAGRIERLTTPLLYEFSFQQAQDGSVVLVLDAPEIE
jgi:hypothetical protein